MEEELATLRDRVKELEPLAIILGSIPDAVERQGSLGRDDKPFTGTTTRTENDEQKLKYRKRLQKKLEQLRANL